MSNKLLIKLWDLLQELNTKSIVDYIDAFLIVKLFCKPNFKGWSFLCLSCFSEGLCFLLKQMFRKANHLQRLTKISKYSILSSLLMF